MQPLATPDTTISVLIALGLGSLLGPWWIQAAWLVAAVLIETWHQLDRDYQHAHGDGW